MNEEEKTLKERFTSIMRHRKKSKTVMLISAPLLLLLLIISAVVFLGAGIGNSKTDIPPKLYISSEYESTKEAVLGGYNWSYKNKNIIADSSDPAGFQYKLGNTVSADKNEQLVIGTQKLKKDKKYEFTVEKLSIYKGGKPIEDNPVKPSFMNGSLYLQAPSEQGEYIYVLTLNFKDMGTADYGFVVRVDMPTYDLAEISKYKTPYIGDNSKVSAIVQSLPVPEHLYFKQQYISLSTAKKPYGLTVFYELREGESPKSDKLITMEKQDSYPVLKKNALVLFSMIDNMDVVTFAFRNSQSNDKLEETAYESYITITRGEIKAEYGDISKLSTNLDQLQKVLNNETGALQQAETAAGEYIELDKLPEVYNSQLAIQNGDVVFTFYDVYNSNKFEEFYEAYKAGKKDKVYRIRITSYTDEGDAIIRDLTMNGQDIKVIEDTTRDKFASAENRKINEYQITKITKDEKNGKIQYTFKGEKAEFNYFL